MPTLAGMAREHTDVALMGLKRQVGKLHGRDQVVRADAMIELVALFLADRLNDS